MEIAQGIHHFSTGPFNWYVIEESGRLTLVDAGFPSHYGVFIDGLTQMGKSLKDLDAIILTHAHADHTGFADRVRREARVPVFIHRDDLEMSAQRLQLPWFGLLSNAWRPFTAGMLGRATINGVFIMPSIHGARPFDDRAVLDVPGKPRVIHIPGHTAGQVAFHLPDRGVLISGDTLVTRDLFTGTHTPPLVPRALLNHDDLQARRSIGRLSDLGNVTILPGHGRPWRGTMAEAIALQNSLR